jgi:anti-anti-sigma regulatory factor
MPDFEVDPVSIDVGRLVRRNVASLYSSLVTRPTGQAVRLAIENVLAEEAGPVSLSVIDLSHVTVIDFSCADEVVAKLLLRFLEDDRPRDAFFVFRGIRELHRDPIEVVLERQTLAAVSETESGAYEVIGSTSWEELKVWQALEGRGRVKPKEVHDLVPGNGVEETLGSLVRRRLVFRNPLSGEYQALSDLLHCLT